MFINVNILAALSVLHHAHHAWFVGKFFGVMKRFFKQTDCMSNPQPGSFTFIYPFVTKSSASAKVILPTKIKKSKNLLADSNKLVIAQCFDKTLNDAKEYSWKLEATGRRWMKVRTVYTLCFRLSIKYLQCHALFTSFSSHALLFDLLINNVNQKWMKDSQARHPL